MMTRAEAEELLRTLFADPDARTRSEPRTSSSPTADPALASIGHQVVGIVLRDLGETDAALAELRTALRLARRSGDQDRWGDALATLGLTLCSRGVDASRDAQARPGGVRPRRSCPSARALVRRAYVTGPPARPVRGERRRPAGGAGGSSPARATTSGRGARSTSRGSSTSGWATSRPRRERSRRTAELADSAGDAFESRSRPAQHRLAGDSSAATCRSRWSCTPTPAHASTRSG